MSAIASKRILRLPQVENLTGLKRSAIYGLEAAGDFPTRIKLTPKASGWVESEVAEWIKRRIAAGRSNEKSNGDKNAAAL